MSYLILPELTTSYPVSPLSTPSYVVSYCHPMWLWLALVGWGETGGGGWMARGSRAGRGRLAGGWQEATAEDVVGGRTG